MKINFDYVLNIGNSEIFDDLYPSGEAYETAKDAIDRAETLADLYGGAYEVVYMPEDNDDINEIVYRIYKRIK